MNNKIKIVRKIADKAPKRGIKVIWTPGVSADERGAVVAGIEEVLVHNRRTLELVDSTYRLSQQRGTVNADAALNSMPTDGYLQVALTTKDLSSRDGWLFGLARSGHAVILSVARLTTQATLKLLAGHEVGHLLGLVREEQQSHDNRSGFYWSHCTNVCAMRQVMSVAEAQRLAAKLVERSFFCPQCIEFLENTPVV